MNKYKKHIQLFFADHIGMIILFNILPVSLILIAILIIDTTPQNLLYFLFLSFIMLGGGIWVRFYTTWNLYSLLLSDENNIDDFVLAHPRSNTERRYKSLFSNLRKMHINKLIELEDNKNAHRLMIYRWIHHLKTPLSVIRLIGENHNTEEDYIRILQAVFQIQYDLDQVLDLYKLEAIETNFHVEKVNLYELTKDSINDLKSFFIQNSVFPKMEIDKNLFIYTDRKWIRFVLYQLFTNAVKYSNPGGHVQVSTLKSNHKISLMVRDNGCGIEKGDLSRIFDLYFTGQNGKYRRESSGLGLYMVKQILNYLDHPISVTSEPLKGSTFTIDFHID